VWQSAHDFDLCTYFVFLNATLGVWHVEQADPKWPPGAPWQRAQSEEVGCENAHDVPIRLWQLEHPIVRLWPAGGR
jgi:hypothetical protein